MTKEGRRLSALMFTDIVGYSYFHLYKSWEGARRGTCQVI